MRGGEHDEEEKNSQKQRKRKRENNRGKRRRGEMKTRRKEGVGKRDQRERRGGWSVRQCSAWALIGHAGFVQLSTEPCCRWNWRHGRVSAGPFRLRGTAGHRPLDASLLTRRCLIDLPLASPASSFSWHRSLCPQMTQQHPIATI